MGKTGFGIRRGAFAGALAVLAAFAWSGLAKKPAPRKPRAPSAAPAPEPRKPDLAAEAKRQYDDLAGQLKNRKWFASVASQTFREDALILPADRDPLDVVLRRSGALLKHLSARPGGPDLAAQARLLAQLAARAARTDVKQAKARYALYEKVCGLRRRIALANPLLDFDKLLFIKRHDAGGPYHMVDQYYGCNAKPGGGLYVLHDPFGAEPKLVDVLAEAVVGSGRLKGRKLAGGSFLSPELNFDAGEVYFAWTQAKAKKTYTWGPEISYHIFKVGADGAGLVQLTDGPSDDFDPCVLPGGRVAFISLRRGGYLRCGRHCPTYTMFSMKPDGSDIAGLSFHETHEWHPSVTNDGMIVYTRWDYIDRDTNVAHHIWTCYPDGRDPRSVHGNYPARREARPWMEMSIRAIPGSHRFVTTAAAHHGHAFGSLVLIDQQLEDDGAMSQLKRLTPEVPFPESEGGKGGIRANMVYATAWPLSEDYYLCAYDPAAKRQGIYLLDSFGNRDLIYRDASIACLDPIPLRPRPRPPVIPPATTPQAAGPGDAAGPATVTVVNVYDSDFDWPADTRIKALRIIQVLPKTTAPPNQPRIGVANQSSARAVLGTVPVETDGSACFEAPPGKAMYFQALDADGLAVQSMRSSTYMHPGEQLTCLGCHEPKRRTSGRRAAAVPLALQRKASKIAPDVDGANPFNYPRLVQPVLDRNCVPCHTKNRKKKAPDLTGGPGRKNGWTRSYESLAAKYGFYFHVSNGSIKQGVHGGSRTVAGKFGAKASKLYAMLRKGHNDVKLSKEDMHRITLWLDCNSEFYGAYKNTEAQSRGEPVRAALD